MPATIYADAPAAGGRDAAATTWTSSPTPSGRPTGAATTTSPRSIFEQMQRERHPVPRWVVVGAGTGGTSATIGRYIRYRRLRHAAVRGRSGALGVLRLLPYRRRSAHAGPRLGHRGHRPAARRAIVHPHRRRPDDQGAGRGLLAAMLFLHKLMAQARRAFDRDQPLGRVRADRRDGRSAARRARSSR